MTGWLRVGKCNISVHQWDSDGPYRVMLKIVKVGCHPVAIVQVVEH